MSKLRLYLEATRGLEATKQLFNDIDDLLVHSAKAVQNVMINDRHCFECYGYDLLIDDNLKPWLVEVNASPSLATTTEADKQMKMSLIRDVLEIVIPDGGGSTSAPGSQNRGPCKDQGDFVVLYDEAAEQEKIAQEEAKKHKVPSRNSRQRSWK